jgi:hypothetical protein
MADAITGLGNDDWIRRAPDEEFVGYTFQGSPERRPRLWFLDRYVCWFIKECTCQGGHPIDVGAWSITSDPQAGCDEAALAGLCLRYDHWGAEKWSAVWRLTDTTIPHITTFGRDDDVWRLGVWPD